MSETFGVLNSKRCPRCAFYGQDCLCEEIVAVNSQIKTLFIVHYREMQRASNTTRLAHLLLNNSQICLYGNSQELLDLSNLSEQSPNYLLLYPEEGSICLSQVKLSPNNPTTLVVPDGSWRQTRRMVKRIPGLEQIPSVHLPPGPPTKYALRRQTQPHHISTIEAVARSLGILESQALQQHLEQYFQIFVERELVVRGKVRKGVARK